MTKIALTLAALLALCSAADAEAQPDPSETKPTAPAAGGDTGPASEEEQTPVFRSLQLVLLMAPADRPDLPKEEVIRLQELHLAHLTRMGEEGKMLAAGPFGDQKDPAYRGLCLYDVGSVEEARRLAEADPAVVAGRMRVEVMTWWFHAEALAFPWAARLERERAEALKGG